MLKLLRELLPGDLGFCLLHESDAPQHHALQQALRRTREELSQKVKTLEGVLGVRSEENTTGLQETADAAASGEGGGVVEERDVLVVTPTSLCEPRLELATDAALSMLHA